MHFKKGMLVKIINADGIIAGIGVHIETFRPSERGIVSMHTYALENKGIASASHWHYEVLMAGALRWLHTNAYTMIGIEAKDE